MPLIRIVLLFAALSAAVTARAAQTQHIEGKLDNGLVYHIFNVPAAGQRLAMRLQIDAGTADENAGEEGIAHITEHLVFQSSTAYPQGLSAHLNAQGWQMGRHYNALTGYHSTRYMLIPPQGTRQLTQALAVYRQILSAQPFSADDWAREQQVILGEWRQQQTVQNRLNQQQHALLYSGSRTARYAPIGSKTAIDSARADTASRFHNKWYGSNNAVLVVVGKLDVQQTAAQIRAGLGSLNAIPLPARNAAEYEPKLTQTPYTAYLKDKDNSESKLALVFRFNNATSQARDAAGDQSRLLDNFAAHIIHRRLQQSGAAVSLKQGNIGKQTGSLGFYADSEAGKHQETLAQLKQLVEQIRQQPASEEETAAYRKVLHQHLKNEPLPDDIQKIVQLADETLLAGQPAPSAERRAQERSQLYQINAAAVNRRIGEWLNAPDQLTLIQAPESVLAAEASRAAAPAAKTANKTKKQQMPEKLSAAPAAVAVPAATPSFPVHPGQGKLAAEGFDHDNKVTYLTFSNGDKAVLLQKAVAGSQLYFKAIADSGYQQSGTVSWQAQLAADVVSRSAPAGFSAATFKQWQQQQGISFNYRLDNNRQSTDAQAPQHRLEALLQLYRSRQLAPTADNWQAALETAAVRQPVFLQSLPGRLEQEWEILRHGQTEARAGDANDIRALSQNDLLQQWRQLAAAPVTYYLVSNQPPEKLKPLLIQYLADIPRKNSSNRMLPLLEGATLRRVALNDTGGTDINAWSWQPFYDWTPETSEQIPLLVNLANARLKNELRSRHQSVYGARFSAEPQPTYNRVESKLSFSTSPAQAAEAWQAAQQILTRLPEDISKTEADNLQRLFIEQEAKRQQNPEIWLERLAASHHHYGDARYLSRLPELHRTIIQTRLRQTAKLLWFTPNARVMLVDPK